MRKATVGTLVVAGFILAFGGCSSPADPRIEAGRRIFMEVSVPSCSSCHTLVHAGATAQIGPDLDRILPDSAKVHNAVRGGLGIMPSQTENLTSDEIAAVAWYVSQVAGS